MAHRYGKSRAMITVLLATRVRPPALIILPRLVQLHSLWGRGQ